MDTKETKTGRTGQGSVSGRSSPGSKLKTEETAKKASGKKLQGEKASQAAAGEKLRFDKAVFDTESKAVERGRSHGRNTPKGSYASTLISDTVHQKVDKESDDNAGTEALNRAASLPSIRRRMAPMPSPAGVRKARSRRNTRLQRPEKAPALRHPVRLRAARRLQRTPEKRQRKRRMRSKRSVNSWLSTRASC